MTTGFALFILSAVLYTAPAKKLPSPTRRYVEEENDPLRFQSITFLDDEGNMLEEDLSQPDLQPRIAVTEDDIKLYFYTRRNLMDPVELVVNNLNGLKNSELYNRQTRNIFIIHGWKNNYQSEFNTIIKDAVLRKSDSNVFIVDWSRIANRNYFTAAASVHEIGEYIGDFINLMMDHFYIKPFMFNLIGHSLGAHLAGCVGYRVNGLVGYIIGLDPAGPLFSLVHRHNRLDEDDAEVVHILHTSGGWLGLSSSIGHADYFPNDGSRQPGCGIDVFGMCAHSRSYYYLQEAILGGAFTSTQCNNYKSFKQGKCQTNPKSSFGAINPDKRAFGDYYLETREDAPYSLS